MKTPQVFLLVILALAATGCRAKKETLHRQQSDRLEVENLRKDSLLTLTHMRYGGELRIRIDETTREKDTLGRTLRETVRRYHLQQQDSSQQSLRRESIGETFSIQKEETQAEARSELATDPPLRGFWTGITALLAGVAGWMLRGVLRK